MLFVGVAAVVSRDGWTTLVMVLCLTSIPIVVLGVMGHLAMPVDIIASPAANVALAMGVDSMIHLVTRVRKLGSGRMADTDVARTINGGYLSYENGTRAIDFDEDEVWFHGSDMNF